MSNSSFPTDPTRVAKPSDGTVERPRACPLCRGGGTGAAFPFRTRFNSRDFKYIRCNSCDCVYLDPVPDALTMEKMYERGQYHDLHYGAASLAPYQASARLLRETVTPGARVLDYGCGIGLFLQALREEGFVPHGVEFDEAAARAAQNNAQCEVQTVSEFWADDARSFDAIHLGDVLEHLPDPSDVLQRLLARLRPGGALFAEGPLEINASPVYWVASAVGNIKHLFRRSHVAAHPPTHLYRANGKQQLAFFFATDPTLSMKHWELLETGWPYAAQGVIKNAIAEFSMRVSKLPPMRGRLGNRFRGIFITQPDGT